MNRNFLKYSCGVIALAATGAMSPTASAQDQDGVWELEEIIVTARKRAENIQDVGLSVSAIGQAELERKFSTDIRDLVDISPNLVIDDTAQGPGGVASIYIRGVGVSEVEKNFDPAVGVVVDGIFLGQMSGSLARSIDVERVEVLRGPQGTLFGRNTIGGVVKLERTKPTGELGAKLRASYGNYEILLLDGIMNFGLGEQLALKLSGTYRDQGKGYYTNLNNGRDVGRIEYQSIGANLLWTPQDNIELEYTYQRERTDQDTPPLLNLTQPNQVLCLFFAVCAPDTRTPTSGSRYATLQDYEGAANLVDPGLRDVIAPGAATFDADTHIFEVRWDIDDDLRLDYIFGSWETRETVLTDWDGDSQLFFHTSRPAEYKQTSHELRLTGSTDEKLSWVFGAYVWDSEYEVRLRSFICFGCALPGGLLDLPQTTNQTTESWALFFEGDYDLSDRLTFTLGGRFTEDRKSTAQTGVVNAAANDSWDQFTPKVGLKYRINDDAMVYATYSQGYRSGGFNGRVDSVEVATTPYDAETIDNYEIGFKTEWLDNRLRLNVTAFYMDYKDKQEELQFPSATSGTGQVTLNTNASTATIKGLEADLLWYPVEGLSIRANLGILDAGYDEFTFIGLSGTTDFSDLDFRRAPKVTASISGNYEWAVGSGTAVVGGGWHFIGAHEVDFANKPELHNESQHLLDASAGYRFNNIEINVFARNIAKADGYSIGFDVAGLWSYAATRAPRTYGLEVNYRFGG